MRKLLKTINGSCLIQSNDELWVFPEHEVCPEDLSTLSPEDWTCDAQVQILPENKIKVLQLQELHQFNNSHCLLTTIKLLSYGLALNGQNTSKVDSYLESPETYRGEPLSQVSMSFKKEVNGIMFDAIYQFSYKDKQIKGQGQFIKYTYFEEIETLPESLEEVFNLYVNLNKLIADACAIGNDDMFLPCDDWATVKYGNQAKYRRKNGN